MEPAASANAPTAAPAPATLGAMRAAFLDLSEFDDGEVTYKPIEWVKLGPLPIPVPNPPARVHALKLHDLHHILTGYGTDWRGEYEISGWEVGAGLHRNPIGWMFCTMGFTAGLVVSPRRTVRAFARGRKGRSLLGQDPAAAFALTEAEGHAFCGTDQPHPEATAGDVVRAMAWGVLGVFTGLLPPLAWLLARFDRAPEVMLPMPSGQSSGQSSDGIPADQTSNPGRPPVGSAPSL